MESKQEKINELILLTNIIIFFFLKSQNSWKISKQDSESPEIFLSVLEKFFS